MRKERYRGKKMALHKTGVKTGVNVPVSFEFAPTLRQWFVGSAEVLGWHGVIAEKKRQGELKRQRAGGGLVANLPSLHAIPLLGRSLVDDFVALQVHLSKVVQGSPATYELTVPRTDVPNLPAEWTEENNPDLHLASFPILVSPPQNTLAKAKAALLDPREMRGCFFDLESGDNFQLAEFLTKWGQWGGERVLYKQSGALWQISTDAKPEDEVLALFPHHVWSLHSGARSGAAGTPKEWFTKTLPNHFGAVSATLFTGATIRHTYPYFVVRHHFCQQAIVDAITIDQLRGIKHRFCKRKQCMRLYEKTNNHKTDYCSKACGTAVRVKRFRTALKKKSTGSKD
jgi:hypothetical protein